MKIFELVSLPLLIAALVGGTNILTAVTKKVVDVHKAEVVVVIWAEFLSILAAFCAAWLEGAAAWQACAMAGVCGALIGALVSYAAMFGYDELYERVTGMIGSVFSYLWKKGNADGE